MFTLKSRSKQKHHVPPTSRLPASQLPALLERRTHSASVSRLDQTFKPGWSLAMQWILSTAEVRAQEGIRVMISKRCAFWIALRLVQAAA